MQCRDGVEVRQPELVPISRDHDLVRVFDIMQSNKMSQRPERAVVEFPLEVSVAASPYRMPAGSTGI